MTDEIDVIINGEKYIKATPTVDLNTQSILDQVLATKIRYEHGEKTINDYLYDLLSTLWDKEEGFSGKRPFGNSGWKYNVLSALVKGGIIAGVVDADGYVDIESVDLEKADKLIVKAINYIFYC